MSGITLRVLVTGSRDWHDRVVIRQVLELLPASTLIVHGACRGADLIADEIARELGFKVSDFHANWKHYGAAAGPIRNGQMLSIGKPDLCVYFHHNLEASKGTRDMTERVRLAGLPLFDGARVARDEAYRGEFLTTVLARTRVWKG